eukprot:630020-Amorphochlora_amoeboformis.AAC.2
MYNLLTYMHVKQGFYLGSPVVVLVGDRRDERLDVHLRRTGLFARRVSTFEAARSLFKASSFRESRVLNRVGA